MRPRRIPLRTLSATVASLGVLGLAGPVAGAVAATAPAPASPLLTFVPPSIGPLSVYIGPTIIGGQVISPGLYVRSPGISLPPITWTPPQMPSQLPSQMPSQLPSQLAFQLPPMSFHLPSTG
jgi:hypothetical protein